MKKKKKKYLINQENNYNKKIKELFEKEEDIIYIKGEFNNYFNLQFFWVSEKRNNTYIMLEKKKNFMMQF